VTVGPPRRVAFLGFGLIAGSIARALSAGGTGAAGATRPELVAWSPSNAGPEAALRDGVLTASAAEPADALEDADLVVIGAPPIETVRLVEALGGPLRTALAPDAVVTDVASTKAEILGAANAAGLRFVGGHPMAGREVAGYSNSAADLFVGRPWILVPGAAADEAAAERVAWVATACGARPVRMDAAAHDAAAAAISHLPLVVAAALAEAVAGGDTLRDGWPAAAPLAASGWRDMTRLARGDARMGAGIATTNAAALAAGLRELRGVLDTWIADLERDGGPDPTRLEARLRAVRDRLERAPGDGG
jgi:prephenate dehydrogenase